MLCSSVWWERLKVWVSRHCVATEPTAAQSLHSEAFWQTVVPFNKRSAENPHQQWQSVSDDERCSRRVQGLVSCHPPSSLCDGREVGLQAAWALLAGRHAADLRGALRPRLEVLQSKQGAVLQAQWIWSHRLVDGLLEGLLLQLHQDPVGLLPLGLTLLCSLPSAWQESVCLTFSSERWIYPEMHKMQTGFWREDSV